MNIEAIEIYHEAQLMQGPFDKGPKLAKIREGIEVFPNIQAAIKDAEENIARTTKSDFNIAWFYENVLTVAKQMAKATILGRLT